MGQGESAFTHLGDGEVQAVHALLELLLGHVVDDHHGVLVGLEVLRGRWRRERAEVEIKSGITAAAWDWNIRRQSEREDRMDTSHVTA